MDNKRRQLLKSGLAVGGASLFAAGYSTPAKKMADGLIHSTSGEKTDHSHFGNALKPEYTVSADGEFVANPEQRIAPSMCYGCWSLCGIRVRIDNKTDDILRISGNPYHPLSSEPPLPYSTSIKDSYLGTSGEQGLKGRSTACARGNSMMDVLNSPYRITQPLKRVGKRGEGRWEPISYEQLIEEVVEGGDLFGEGHVDGLRAIRDTETLIDPENPEYGPKSNQLLMTNASNRGRADIIKRFAFNSFGTPNYGHHGPYCGQSMRAGGGAVMNDLNTFAHVKPDIEHSEFVLYIGTAPAQAGNPFKRQARQLAAARTRDGQFDYVVVTPSLPLSSSLSAGDNNRWLAIKPGTDSALIMGMIQWIIENERYNAKFLSLPSQEAMAAADMAAWCNATYLVISDENHPRHGAFLRASEAGMPYSGEPLSATDPYVIVDAASGELSVHNQAKPGQLFVTRTVTTSEGDVLVKSSLQRLKEEAFKYDMDFYSEQTGISVENIVALARKFTSHGHKAAVDTHGGTMHSNGFYTAYSIKLMNALIGSTNMKGGAFVNSGGHPSSVAGPRYDFSQFPGKIAPKGIQLSRSKFPYEKSSEYKRRVAAGESPYPTRAPWYPLSPGLLTEHLSAAIDGYPYRLKAWINHMTNPIYAIAGLKTLAEEKLKDPKVLPLIVSVHSFINESAALSDYIVPDTVTYESWGMSAPWGNTTKTTAARWPVVEPRTEKTPDGRSINLENFIIDVAKKMDLPGFGDNVLPDAEGNWHGIHSGEDFYLRAAANFAYITDKDMPAASKEDIQLSGLSRITEDMKRILTLEEFGKVAYVFARGGYFVDDNETYDGDKMRHRWQRPLAIWNETLGTSRNSMTGEQYSGCPTWYPQKLADGTPLETKYPASEWPFTLSSFKSNTHSSASNLSPRLNAIKSHNPVFIHPEDAQQAGIQNGDMFTITTPGNAIEATAILVHGVKRGTLAIEHGFGHTELGQRAHWIGDQQQPVKENAYNGVNLNDLGLIDPTREGKGVLLDWVTGSAARQALPAKISLV